MFEVNAAVQAEAAIQSAANEIDTLAVIDRQIKELTEQSKILKESIANTYGEGKHRGEKYGVTVSLVNTTTVDWKALAADLGITAEQIAQYTKKGASIRVSCSA